MHCPSCHGDLFIMVKPSVTVFYPSLRRLYSAFVMVCLTCPAVSEVHEGHLSEYLGVMLSDLRTPAATPSRYLRSLRPAPRCAPSGSNWES